MQGDSSVCCLSSLHTTVMHGSSSLSFKLVLIHPSTSILFNTAHVYRKRGREVHMVKRPGLPLAFSCCHGRRGDCHWVGLCFLGSVCSNLSSQLGECVEGAVTGNKVSLISKPLGCNATVRLVGTPRSIESFVFVQSVKIVWHQNIYLQCKHKYQQLFWRSIPLSWNFLISVVLSSASVLKFWLKQISKELFSCYVQRTDEWPIL